MYEARLETIRELRHAKTHPESRIHQLHAESAKDSTDPIVVHMDEESPVSYWKFELNLHLQHSEALIK